TSGNAYIFQFNERYDIDGTTLRNKARYINHSCDPNCETLQTQRAIWIMALRDIKAGEELTYNYGYGLEEGYPLKAGQLTYDCRYSTMYGMPVTGGRGFRGLKPLWYNSVPPSVGTAHLL